MAVKLFVTLPARNRSPALAARPLLRSAVPLLPRHTPRASRTSATAPGIPAATAAGTSSAAAASRETVVAVALRCDDFTG